MPSHVVDVATVRPLERPEALAVAQREYGRYVDQLRGLADADWLAETECPPWNVQQMAAHVLGQTEFIASIREFVHQRVATRHDPGDRQDAVNELQIRDRAGLSPPELVDRLADAAPASIRARRRHPGFVRRIGFPIEFRGGPPERWTFAYLFDVIFTRDIWMHRLDTARAVGADVVATPDHDGRIVEDIVADWARRHGKPFELRLEGPAGGAFRSGTGGELLELDALLFCRLLSGRGGGGEGLLGTPTPF
jgi:uncharacterized protein (TIGR03083 family)